MRTTIEKFRDAIRVIPDFPKQGILFRDITPVLAKPELCAEVLNELGDRWNHVGFFLE
jgi:adenine phosphoribosyltransferase